MVNTVTLNCARLADRELAHTYLAGSLSLPAWYGRNLDALYDCLTDMGPCALVLEDADSLRRAGGYGSRILDAIDDAARANPALTVEYRPAPMPTLFSLDGANYDPRWPAVIRPSVRAIILRGDKIALVHSLKYDYYKFPGGGVEPGEDRIAALVREVREEAALAALPESVRPYGMVLRTEKGACSSRTTTTISAAPPRRRSPRTWTAMRRRRASPRKRWPPRPPSPPTGGLTTGPSPP